MTTLSDIPLRFYERQGCHLCEDAWDLLRSVTTERVDRIDIDGEDDLVVRYGLRIPVLEDGEGTVLAEGIFDAATLRRSLT